MNRETFEELIPAYALGALDDDERREFEALLADDPEAQRLVAEYQSFTDLLVLTTPARPAPTHLQADLRQRLAKPSNITPINASPAAARRVSALPTMVALAAVLAVVIGVVYMLARGQGTSARDIFNQLAAQPDTVRVALAPQPGFEIVAGELVTDRNQAVICMDAMPPLEADQAFQLWFAYADSTLQSSDTFQPQPNGETCVMVPVAEASAEYQAFAVSIEPTGGSPDPTQPSGAVVFTVPVNP